jgi:hypothetical protein
MSALVVMIVHKDKGSVREPHSPVRDIQVEEGAPVLEGCLRHLLAEPEQIKETDLVYKFNSQPYFSAVLILLLQHRNNYLASFISSN